MRSDDQFATHEKRIEREQEKMGRRATCLRLLFADREHRKVEDNMSQTKTMTVRISEYVRELIRRAEVRQFAAISGISSLGDPRDFNALA